MKGIDERSGFSKSRLLSTNNDPEVRAREAQEQKPPTPAKKFFILLESGLFRDEED